MGEHPLHVVTVAGLVTRDDGHVLLVRVAGRGWELPGGRVEQGEDLVEALEREVDEEAGCRVRIERLVGVYSKLTPPEMVLHLFRCRHLSGDPRPSPDTPEAGWFPAGEARRLVTEEPNARRLRDGLDAGRDGGVLYRVYRLRPYEDVRAERV